VVLDDGGLGFVTSAPGTAGSVSSTIVAFDTNSGQPAWAVQPGFFVDQMFAQDGGGVIVHGIDLSHNAMTISIVSTNNSDHVASTPPCPSGVAEPGDKEDPPQLDCAPPAPT